MPADVELGISVKRRGDGADAVARDLKGAAREADRLDDDLKAVNRQLIEMKTLAALAGREFVKTGDASPLKQLLKDERELKTVQKSLLGGLAAPAVRKGLTSAIADGVSGAGDVAASAVSKWPLAAGVAGAIVAGAPLISAAVVGVLGGGALAGGILLAARSPAVQDAWAEFGRRAGDTLSKDAAVFEQPLIDATHRLGGALDTLHIDSIFKNAAKSVLPLTDGLISLAHEALPGIEHAVAASAPFFRDLAQRDMPALGRAVGQFADEMARAEPGASLLFGKLVEDTGRAVVTTGALVEGISKIVEAGNRAPALLKGIIDPGGFLLSADAASKVPPQLDNIGGSARGAAADVAFLETKFRTLADQQLGSANAAIGWERSFDGVTESVKANGRSLDIGTEAGRRNAEALLGGVEAARREREANIAAGMSVDQANAKYGNQVGQLEALAVKLGLSKDKTWALIDGLKNIPKEINVSVNISATDYGVHAAGERATGGGAKYVPPIVGSRSQFGGSGALVKARASGGPVWPGGTFLVGEEAPELLTIGGGGRGMVTPLAGASRPAFAAMDAPARLPVVGARGGGGGATTINLTIGAGSMGGGSDQALLSWLGEALRGGRLQLKVSSGGRVVPA